MKKLSQFRQNLNDKTRDYGNHLYDGLGDLLTSPIDKLLLGSLALGTGLALTGCGDDGLKYGDQIQVRGNVIEINKKEGDNFLIRSGNQLYHIGTKNDKWNGVGKGDEVVIKGTHGGRCEEEYLFEKDNPDSDDVTDIVKVYDLDVTHSAARAQRESKHAQNRTDFGPFKYNNKIITEKSEGFRKGNIVQNGWEYVMKRGDVPEKIVNLYNKLDEAEGNPRHEMTRYHTYVLRDGELVNLVENDDVKARVGEKIFIMDSYHWE